MEQSIQQKHREEGIDFVKGVLIVLMIIFHLVYVADSFPYAKKVVYAFHMPGFLIISGYLMNVEKTASAFLRTLKRFVVPYLIIESAYILMASVLPIREHIHQLTPALFAEKLFLHPLGPYWYLHTLVLCGATYYLVFRIRSLAKITRWLLLAFLLCMLSFADGILSVSYALYFIIGVAIRLSGLTFTGVFRPSFLAVPLFFLLSLCGENLLSMHVGSLALIFCALSGLLFVNKVLHQRVAAFVNYLGRRSLALYLYSPIFTFLCKPLVPLFQFDPTCVLFILASSAVCVGGALLVDGVVNALLEMIKRRQGASA